MSFKSIFQNKQYQITTDLLFLHRNFQSQIHRKYPFSLQYYHDSFIIITYFLPTIPKSIKIKNIFEVGLGLGLEVGDIFT